MRFSRFFIDRPVFAVVLSLVVLAAGLIAIRSLPISEYPEVTPPTISVRAVYPGANPAVLAQTVGTPLEDAINGVEHMLYMSSSATAVSSGTRVSSKAACCSTKRKCPTSATWAIPFSVFGRTWARG